MRTLATACLGLALLLSAPACKREDGKAKAAELAAVRARDLEAVRRLDFGRVWPSGEWSALAASPAWEAREALAHAIGRAAILDGPPILYRLLADPEVAVRRAAAFGLGCYEARPSGDAKRQLLPRLWGGTDGSVVDATKLAPRLKDDDWRVRVAALTATARAAGPGAAAGITLALRTAWTDFATGSESVRSERVQVLVAALEAAAPRGPSLDAGL